jgi:hypothetical protein
VDVRNQSGPLVAAQVRAIQPAPEVSDTGAQADTLIAQIVSANSAAPTDP